MPVVDGQEYELLNYEDLKHFHHQLVEHKHVDPTKTSTIRVTTSEADLLGCDVTVKISGHVYVQPFPETLTDGIAEVNIVVTELGIATVSATSVSGDEITEAVDINAFYITAEVELALILYLYKDGNEYENLTSGWIADKGNLIKNADNMALYYYTSTTNTNSVVKMNNKIDGSKFTKFNIDYQLNISVWTGLTNASMGVYEGGKQLPYWSDLPHDNDRHIFTFDIPFNYSKTSIFDALRFDIGASTLATNNHVKIYRVYLT